MMAGHQPHTCGYCDKFLIDTANDDLRIETEGATALEGALNGCDFVQGSQVGESLSFLRPEARAEIRHAISTAWILGC
jgi:hypothetical protein